MGLDEETYDGMLDMIERSVVWYFVKEENREQMDWCGGGVMLEEKRIEISCG